MFSPTRWGRDGKNFANLYLDADIVYEDLSGDDRINTPLESWHP